MATQGTALFELREEFRGYDNDLRSDLLIEYAEQFSAVPQEVATRPYPQQAKVPACESEVYLFVRSAAEGLDLWYAVENPQGIAAKALAVILQQTLRQVPLEVVAQIDESLVYDFFGRSISMGKGQGLMGMVQMLRAEAKARLGAPD